MGKVSKNKRVPLTLGVQGFQDGGEVEDKTYNAGLLPEININAKKYPYINELSTSERRLIRDKSPIGQQIRNKATYGEGVTSEGVKKFATNLVTHPLNMSLQSLQTPQSLMVEGVEAARGNKYNFQDALPSPNTGYNTQRTPSQTFLKDSNAPVQFAGDILIDPLSVAGIIGGGTKYLKNFGKSFKVDLTDVMGSSKNQPFKSEINWGKWNPDTPKYPELVREYNTIEKAAKADGTWMKNPDGSSFKGTPEQFVQQQSKNFKKAFGDSKLLNEDGSPMKIYHGSAKKFDAFDESKFQLGDSGYSGKGIYTTPSKTKADSYALSSGSFHKGEKIPTTYELYGQANKPIRSSELPEGYDLFDFHRDKNWQGKVPAEKQLRNYDAAIVNKKGMVDRVFPDKDAAEIVFPTNKQLKSAKGNVGFFDMTNPNIYKSVPPVAVGAGIASQQNTEQKRDGGNVKAKEKRAENLYDPITPQWSKVKSIINPENWGVSDYTDTGDFDAAYNSARQSGEEEFMWNNKRYSTKMKPVAGDVVQKREDFDGNLLSKISLSDRDDWYKKEKLSSLYEYFAGLPLTDNSLEYSKYKPTNSKDENASYISVNNDNFLKDLFDSIDYNFKNKDTDTPREYRKDIDKNNYVNVGHVALGHSTFSRGEDKKGKYYSMYDIFDTSPNVGELLGANKPYEIYNRIYYKDYGDGKNKRMYYSDKELNELDLDKKDFDTLALQRELSNRGYKLPKSTKQDGAFDGIFGDETKNALLEYKKSQNKSTDNKQRVPLTL